MNLFRKAYGAGPLHLLGHAVVIAISAYALSVMFRGQFAPQPWNLILWLLGGAILHDLVFLPAYSAINVGLDRVFGGRPTINYLRVPAVISGVCFIAFYPRITNRQPFNFERALGHAPPDYLGRWLAFTAALFAGSLVVWAVQRVRAGQGQRSGDAGSSST